MYQTKGWEAPEFTDVLECGHPVLIHLLILWLSAVCYLYLFLVPGKDCGIANESIKGESPNFF